MKTPLNPAFRGIALALAVALGSSALTSERLLAQVCTPGDNAMPTIVIQQPDDGVAVHAGRIPRLRGTIRDASPLAAASLRVSAPDNSNQTFDITNFLVADPNQPGMTHFAITDIELAPGTTTLTVEATDTACTAHTASAAVSVTSEAPPAALNLYAFAIEVTQAIQGRDTFDGVQDRAVARSTAVQPVIAYDGGTLVAHKRTIVRAYAIAEGSSTGLTGIEARLRLRRGDTSVTLVSADALIDPDDPIVEGSLNASKTLERVRGRRTSSWNFLLPDSLTAAGVIDELELVVNPADAEPSAVVECSGCNDEANRLRVGTIAFAATDALHVRAVRMVYDPNDSSASEPAADAGERAVCGAFAHMQPLADGCGLGLGIELLPNRRQSLNATELLVGNSARDMFAIENSVCALMASDRDLTPSPSSPPALYLGIVPGEAPGAAPAAFGSAVDGHPHRRACAAMRELDDSEDRDAAGMLAQASGHGFLHADVAGLGHVAWHACGGASAHELPAFPEYADASGAALPPASIGQFGFDSWKFEVLSPVTHIDFMGLGYCSGAPWISPFTWQMLLDRWRSSVTASDDARALFGGLEDRALAITGLVRADGSLELAPLFALPRPTVLTQPVSGNFILILRGASGTPLFAVPFGVTRHAELVAGGTFAFAAPYVEGVTRIDFQRDGMTLRSFTLTANSPEVTIVQPAGGSVWSADQDERIEWTASDADGDSLSYLIQYSADDGESWETLATGLKRTSLAVDVAELPGSEAARIRVFASDGVQTASETSDRFAVEAKLPRLTVAAAGVDPVAIVESGSVSNLIASYRNIDDPMADPSSISWTLSEIAGTTGPRFSVRGDQLSAGLHTITVSAPDNGGGMIARQLSLLRAPRLVELTTAIPGCVGDCDGSGDVTVDEVITGVNIALGTAMVEACPAFDASGEGQVTVDEILQAVGRALTGC